MTSTKSPKQRGVEALQQANGELMTLLLQLNAVNEMVCSSGMPLDRSKVLEGIAHGIRAELNFDRVAVWRYESVSQSFVGTVGLGVSELLVRTLRFPLSAFLPLVKRTVEDGRLLESSRGEDATLAMTVYEGLGEAPRESVLVPLLSRGKDRCWRVRRVAEGCAKAEAGPERGIAVKLDERHIRERCLPCPVFPIEGFLWADNAVSGRTVSEEMLPLALFLRQADLMLENSTLYESLGRITIQDALTGIYNKAYFEHLLAVEVERCTRYGYPASVLAFDVCGMGRINETFGRQAGDRLLMVLGELVHSRLRRIDYVGRLGGDEFAILLPHTDGTRALRVAERMHEMIARHPFPGAERSGEVKICIGLAVAPDNAVEPDALLGLADYAMHEARIVGPGTTIRIGDPKRTAQVTNPIESGRAAATDKSNRRS